MGIVLEFDMESLGAILSVPKSREFIKIGKVNLLIG
jgi:hypothetical protein